MKIKCEKCKRYYDSGISGVNSSNICITNLSTNCQYCGHINNTEGGTYDFDRSGKETLIKRIKNLNLSSDQMTSLISISIDAQRNVISESDFNNRLIGIGVNPQQIFKGNKLSFMAFLSLLILTLTSILKDNTDKSGNLSTSEKTQTEVKFNPDKIKDNQLFQQKPKLNPKKYSKTDTLLIEARRTFRKAQTKKK